MKTGSRDSIRVKASFNRGLAPRHYSSYIETLPDNLRAAYAKFNASLTPAQRKALNISSGDENPTGEMRLTSKDHSPIPEENSENLYARLFTTYDPEPQEPGEADPTATRLDLIVVLEVIRRLLTIYEVATDPKTRLHGEVIALALGVPGTPTVSELSRRYQCSRQAVSHRLTQVIKALDLPPTWKMAQAANRTSLNAIGRVGSRIRRSAR